MNPRRIQAWRSIAKGILLLAAMLAVLYASVRLHVYVIQIVARAEIEKGRP